MDKKLLYRKVNTRTWGVRRNESVAHYRDQRNSKAASRHEAMRSSMHPDKQYGRDYTPLFRFLLSRVGGQWDSIFSEAVARLDQSEPVFWMVAIHEEDRREIVRLGESSYFSGLYVDEQNCLQKVNPNLKAQDMTPRCKCCTHTFNGIVFGQTESFGPRKLSGVGAEDPPA
ncbi:PAS domain-containing protein [Pseudomonas sp. IT-347P]|uniref:hypothetical protein n=1 Tax=Pseudomonas sp. IT-347P TaxID=3026458 RepID=UPI0039E04157